jgi:hypothetical protein
MRVRVQPLRGFRFIIEILSRETGAVILRSASRDEESHPCFRAGIETTKMRSTLWPARKMLDEILRFAQNDDHGGLRTVAQKKRQSALGTPPAFCRQNHRPAKPTAITS